jgi:hypothetical protein
MCNEEMQYCSIPFPNRTQRVPDGTPHDNHPQSEPETTVDQQKSPNIEKTVVYYLTSLFLSLL